MPLNPVVLIVGPTCTGKTDFAFFLSEQMPLSILNADSLQFYRGLDIGSAKPDFKKYPKVDHYLFDHVSPPDTYTAGQYQKDARALLKDILPKHPALIVGGSGFYLQALEKGTYPVSKVDPIIHKQLMEEQALYGVDALYKELKEKDEVYASSIYKTDKYRIIRALCFIRKDLGKMSDIKKEFQQDTLPYPLIKIGLTASKSVLQKRITLRTARMLKQGLIEETQKLMEEGLQDFPPLSSVGYKECMLYLQNQIQKDVLEERIFTRTMQLVKKQKVWFKRDLDIRWYDCETDYQEIYEDIQEDLLGT